MTTDSEVVEITGANDPGRFTKIRELFNALRWADERHERELWTVSCAAVGMVLSHLYEEPSVSERNVLTVRRRTLGCLFFLLAAERFLHL